MNKTLAVATFLIAPVLTISSASADSHSGSNSDYASTRYPIVFTHGVFGFDKLGSAEYWYGIPEDLRANGGEVFVTQISPINSPEVRGEQLLAQIQQILAVTGAEKVNLIGHSHGAHTVRYVAGVAPDVVASATTMGGANFGTKAADLVYQLQQGKWTGWAVTPFMNTVTGVFNWILGVQHGTRYPLDAEAALHSLTTAETAKFNQLYPEGVPANKCDEGDYVGSNGVHYYSMSGTKTFNNYRDPLDYAMTITGLLMDGPSDGLVERCASHLGKVVRDDYRINHTDEMNHLFGLTGTTDVKSIYRQHANRLQLEGL